MAPDIDVLSPDGATIGFAIVTIIGAFLPWMSVSAPTGPADVSPGSGIEGLGLLTLVLAIVTIGVVLLGGAAVRRGLVGSLVGILVLLVGLWKLAGTGGAAEPGFGLYLTIIGGVGLLVSGLWGVRVGRRNTDREDTP